MKKNSIFKVVLLVILCAVVCTWIFPGLSFSGQLAEGEMSQIGIFDLASYALDLFRYFPFVLTTVLAIGAFYGVAYRIPAYRVLLDTIVEKFKGKENIFLIATIILISAIVSVTGVSLAMLFVFPFIISVILLMGYNKLVAASTTVGSVMVGLLGTTIGSNSVMYVNYILGTKTTDQMIFKVILLLVGMALLILHVLMYSKKTKNDTDKVLAYVPVVDDEVVEVTKEKRSFKLFAKKEKVVAKSNSKKAETKKVDNKKSASKSATKKNTSATKKKAPSKKNTKKTRANDNKNENVKVVKNTKKPSIIPFIVLFDLALIVIALGTFDWTGIVNTKWPTDALKAVNDFKVFGFPILAKVLGTNSLAAFGSWSLNVEIPVTIILTSCILAFIYGIKFDKFIEGIVDGIKKAFIPAFIMLLAYLVLIIATYHPFQLHIARFFLTMTKGFNVVTMTLTAMFASLFNVDSIYVAQSTLPYAVSVVDKASLSPLIAIIWQAVYGATMLIAPTSVILIGTLSYLEIPYTQWIKHIWKLFLELLVALLIIFFIASFII